MATADPTTAARMRVSPRRILKSVFFISVMGFLIININLFLDSSIHQDDDDVTFVWEQTSIIKGHNKNRTNSNDVIKRLQERHQQIHNVSLHEKLGGFINGDNVYNNSKYVDRTQGNINNNSHHNIVKRVEYIPLGNNNFSAIEKYIFQTNQHQKILNLDKFDLATSENTVVIVVQVHKRAEYLKYLIESLKEAKHIEQALLIFSHDYFDDEINQIIHSIDFCPVLQMFYPYSLQLHPHEFPGEDPGDCPRDTKKEDAAKRRCKNADFPDKYGHYREAFIVQTKHHWFWKINHVFDHLAVTKNFNGPVLFLEEDHYVTEDFIYVLQKMYRFKLQSCKDCNIFTIGNYDKKPTYGAYASKGLFQRLFGSADIPEKVDKVDILNWISSKHNMGMSLNREVWEKIKKCGEAFCKFDDYNWDWSLQFISMSCIPNKLRVMVVKSPRTFHIGECGIHHKGKNCDPHLKVAQIKTLLSNNKQFLFPDVLTVGGYPRVPTKMPKANGGWGDHRDHQLCLSFMTPRSH